jgi:acyl-CoA-dependent ceramide synthase
MYATWQFLAPYFGNDLSNPFAPLLFISHPVPNSVPGDQRYQKGPLDVLLLAYHIVVWSFVRQLISVNVARALGPRFGIKKVAKLDRFGEQLYAIVYFSFFGCWGVVSFCFSVCEGDSCSCVVYSTENYGSTTDMVV